jgi:hypothetical protein
LLSRAVSPRSAVALEVPAETGPLVVASCESDTCPRVVVVFVVVVFVLAPAVAAPPVAGSLGSLGSLVGVPLPALGSPSVLASPPGGKHVPPSCPPARSA